MRRLITAALRARRGPTALLFLLAVLAVAAGSAAPLYAESAARDVQRQQYAAADGADRAISARGPVSVSDGNAVGVEVAALRDRLTEAVPGVAGGGALTALTGVELSGSTVDHRPDDPGTGPGPGAGRVTLVARDEACAHLIVTGRCASAPGEAVVAEVAVTALGVTPGARLVVAAPTAPRWIPLTVVGTYRPADPAEPYWAGRSDFAADGRRDPTPVFVAPETIDAARPDSVLARIDLVALEPAAIPADFASPDALADAVETVRSAVPSGVTVTSGLPDLVGRVRFERRLLTTGIAVGASQLVVLCCLVLLLAAGAAAADRRTESALAVLRGAPRRHWAALAVGPTVVALAAASVTGYAVGWLGAWAARRWAFGPPESGAPPVSRASLVLAAATGVVVLAAAVGAEWAAHRGDLLDNLRRTPPRRRRWRVGPVDLVALALAGAAIYQVLTGGSTGGLAVAAPLLLALACGLVAARLFLPAAAAVGTALLHRGRLAGGLAALDLARRPHASGVIAVVTVAVSLVGLAAAGGDTARRAVDERAAMELGADRVLTVESGPSVTRAAVHAADPTGRWAMAAVRVRLGARTLVAVEADRLRVASWPDGAPPAAGVAAALRPAGNRPVTVTGGPASTAVLDITVAERLDLPTRLTMRLFEPDGTARDAGVTIDPAPGRRDHRLTVPGCARGCRLAWFAFPSSPERVRLHALRQRDADGEREVLAPRDFAAPGRWRSGFTTGPGELRLVHGEGWLSAVYRPNDPRYIASEIQLKLADSPVPLPVAAAGPRGAGTRELWTLSNGLRPVEVAAVAGGLPGAAGDGFLFDHEYAERLSGEPAVAGRAEVWLAAGAPDEVVDRLRATLPVTGEETVRQRADRLSDAGAGQAARLHALAALLGLVLAGGAVLTVAAAERRRRVRELTALRTQGLSARVAARSGRLGYAALVGAGLVAGVAAAAANWWATRRLLPVFDPGWTATAAPAGPRPWVAAAALAAAAVVLLTCAGYAAARLGRSTGSAS